MSNNNDNKRTSQIEPTFNEYQAYEELRLIIARALEYGDFAMLEANIAAWKKKYPLDAFLNPEIIRKIKEILNRDFLTRIFGDFWAKKLLHENETLQKYYTNLKEIIDRAKKSGDYKTALKDIKTWKSKLYGQGLSVASFDRSLKSKVCFLLLLPNKKIKNQEEAANNLKVLFEESNKMDKETLSNEITNWQTKYSTKIFDKKLQQEVNDTTAELLESVVNKGNEEESLKKIQGTLASDETGMPYLVISKILSGYDLSRFSEDTKAQICDLASQALFIQEYNKKIQESSEILPESNAVTSLELQALDNLNSIVSSNSHDLDRLVNWIYETRKISFSKYSRDEIIRKFASVGYKVPKQTSYAIPEINIDLSDFSKIKKLQKEIVINYLGIISVGNSISRCDKEKLKKVSKEYVSPSVEESNKKPLILDVYDNFPNSKEENNIDDKSKNNIEVVIEDIIGENAPYSIDLTPPLALSLKENEPQDSLPSDTIASTSEQSFSIQTESDFLSDITIIDNSSKLNADTNIPEIPLLDQTKSLDESIETSSYVLTPEDQSNLEEATYIATAFPIIFMALDNLDKNCKNDYSIEKNNGF